MAADWIATQYRFLERRRGWLVVSLLLLGALGVFCLNFVRFDNSLEIMLPKNSEALRMLRFLHDARFSDKVVFSFEHQDPARLDRTAFFAAIDHFAATAERHAGITGSTGNLAGKDLSGGMEEFLRLTPQLLSPEDLAAAADKTAPDAVGAALRRRHLQLLKPEGAFLAPAIRADPLGISDPVLARLRTLLVSSGYDVRVEGTHLVSTDGRHALLLLDTSVKLTDAAGSRALVEYLRGELAKLPPGMGADMVCGHLHTLGNEDVIKRDIALTVTAAGVCFTLLFLFVFRDPRTFCVVLLSSLAETLAVNLCGLGLGTLSYLIIGFCSVIAGITVDYGLHVYISVRHSRDGLDTVRRLFAPVLAGMLSMLGVFSAFFVSDIPGYRQLAWFAVISIAIAFSAALLIQPHLLSHTAPVPRLGWLGWTPRVHTPRHRAVTVTVFVLLAAAAVWALPRLKFDSSVTQFDGTPAEILRAEERFHAVWGRGDTRLAMLAVTAPDYETALQLNDAVYRDAAAATDPARLSSLAVLWPSARQRAENLAAWQRFWEAGGRRGAVARALDEKGAPFHFSAAAFAPFLAAVDHPPAPGPDPDGNPLFGGIKERFVRRTAGGVHLLTYFPDEDAVVERMGAVAARHPGAFVISRRTLETSLSGTVTREIVKIAAVALLLVLAAAFAVLRSPRAVFVSMLPVLAGGGCFFAVSAWLGRPLNIANLIAGIVVVGMCYDYGVFILYACMRHLDPETSVVVTLCAVATTCGDGVLLFAHHPMLFSLGLTLVTGLTAGYAVAVFVVPDVCRMLGLARTEPADVPA